MVLTERKFLISVLILRENLFMVITLELMSKSIYCLMVSIDDEKHSELTKTK
jgi:hypothetical protein